MNRKAGDVMNFCAKGGMKIPTNAKGEWQSLFSRPTQVENAAVGCVKKLTPCSGRLGVCKFDCRKTKSKICNCIRNEHDSRTKFKSGARNQKYPHRRAALAGVTLEELSCRRTRGSMGGNIQYSECHSAGVEMTERNGQGWSEEFPRRWAEEFFPRGRG